MYCVSKIEYPKVVVIQKYVNPITKYLQLTSLFNRWLHMHNHMGTVSRLSLL